jgi:DNA-binding NtrC family response regulator
MYNLLYSRCGRLTQGDATMSAVLIIEDDRNIRTLLSVNLRSRQYTVYETSNGTDGLTFMRDHHPALVILDYWLPDITGDDILETMSQDETLQHISVIIITASLDIRHLKWPNLIATLIKPIDLQQLLTLVQQATG